MNTLVTGVAGYIGSATAEALTKTGHAITVYDSLVQADLSDIHALIEALTREKFDAVMHFAAFIEAGESMKEPGRFFQNNFTNSLILMENAIRAGVKRFVFSSTAAVYQSSDEPLTEESPLGPTNVYGQTKLMVEQVLEWYRQIHGLHYASLRYFNACGAFPGRGEAHQPESHLIPLVLRIPLGQSEAISIFGTDYPTRGWHLHPRLHPHRRSGFRARVGAEGPTRTRPDDLQPWERRLLFGSQSDQDRA